MSNIDDETLATYPVINKTTGEQKEVEMSIPSSEPQSVPTTVNSVSGKSFLLPRRVFGNFVTTQPISMDEKCKQVIGKMRSLTSKYEADLAALQSELGVHNGGRKSRKLVKRQKKRVSRKLSNSK